MIKQLFLAAILLSGCADGIPQQETVSDPQASLSAQLPQEDPVANPSESEPKREPLVRLGTVIDERISESSGLARCLSHGGAYWTINDSGHEPVLFLLGSDGRELASLSVGSTSNRDWESLDSARLNDQNVILIAEVGDNRRRYPGYHIYVVHENLDTGLVQHLNGENETFKPVSGSVQASKFDFVYEDGQHNCEAIAYDAEGKKIWLVEKVYVDDQRESQPGIYCIDFDPTPDDMQLAATDGFPLPRARRVADFPVRNVTGMSISPDGRRMIIRSYLAAWLFTKTNGQTWAEVLAQSQPQKIALPIQRQGESVCFTPDSGCVIVTSEGRRQPLWQVNIDQQLDPQPDADAAADEAATDRDK